VGGLIEAAGKRWGVIAAVLAALPTKARVTARLIQDWVRQGKLTAERIAGRGRGLLVVALEDVLAIERETRQTRAKRGGRPRKAPVLA
jgi:hypothetical protein